MDAQSDAQLTLTTAYQRLLGELGRRLGAARAELYLHAESAGPLACAGDMPPAGACWLEIPISEAAYEVGRLRMAFAGGAPLPGPAERAMVRALVELAALLLEEHHQLTWGPLRQADQRFFFSILFVAAAIVGAPAV